ncbi:ciliary-associated calcium-binding coiled-coil protein 1 isoform X2 [Globicephala melas]|uniref:ciliary-associated calcium-binding coiled-coil protein 1 isoform X2 n=1 Tax=Globicephala melas TaxID=9731 RepID=UPI00293D2BC8|nr:ciliary-associated calcium-binding coiled-coil protein 1 isoform X2 [Globicephala melas]
MAASVGTTPGGTTPAGMTPAGTTPESEKDTEFQEHEGILCPDFLSVAQITEMLAEDIDGVQQKLEKFLNFRNLQTCLKEASLLDYYVSGFLWARGMDFSIIQYSKFMTLLDMLLHNLKTLHMSIEDSIKWLREVMAEIGPSHSQKNEEWNIFDVKQANAIVDYLKVSLFQHYKLYEFLFFSAREEIVIGTEFHHPSSEKNRPPSSHPSASGAAGRNRAVTLGSLAQPFVMKLLNYSRLLQPEGKALDQLKRVSPLTGLPSTWCHIPQKDLKYRGRIEHITHILKPASSKSYARL